MISDLYNTVHEENEQNAAHEQDQAAEHQAQEAQYQDQEVPDQPEQNPNITKCKRKKTGEVIHKYFT